VEHGALAGLVPALQRRLSTERLLGQVVAARGMLEAALAAIPGAAFVADAAGRVVELNAVGRSWLEREGHGGPQAIAEAARAGSHPGFARTPVAAPGVPTRFLLVARPRSEPSSADRARRAAERWSLTPRQAEVLKLLVDGLANKTIAATLRVSERTVEAHLSVVFEKAQVESRAELAAAVWRGG
jgi:DNA-binding CsgD family transcriptional regulator